MAEALPRTLTHLELNFGNSGIGDDGAQAVGSELVALLTQLKLNFALCDIGDAGRTRSIGLA